jgi:hypothetical protein
MGAPPARNDHGGSLLLHAVTVQIEKPSGRIRKAVEFLNEGLDGVDVYFSLCAISNAINLFKPFLPSALKVFQKEGKTKLSFSQNNIINQRAFKDPVRIATDMGPAHNHDPLVILLLNNPGYLQRLAMIRCKGRGNPEDIRMRTLNPFSDLIPVHSKMTITRIELERASVIQWIISLKVEKLGRERD